MAHDRIRRIVLVLLYFSALCICYTRSQNTNSTTTTPDPENCNFDDVELAHPRNCSVVFIKRSDCPAINFDGSVDDDLGEINLKTYRYSERNIINFAQLNLTFSKIKWTHATFRYKLDAFDDERNTFCKDIYVTDDVKPEAVIFFDKNWIHETKSNLKCTLDVLLENGNKKTHKKLRFSFLDDKELEGRKTNSSTWKIFSYLDVTTPGKAILHWQKPTNFSPISYIATAESNLETKIQNVSGFSAQFEFSRNTEWYNFKVKPVGNECGTGCLEGGYKIGIESLPAISLLVYIIPLIVLVAVLAIFVYIYLPAVRRYQLIGLPKPTVLVVYKSNHMEHTSAVHELAEYLSTKNMKILLYDKEVPKNLRQDPYIWCKDQIVSADIILLVSSPACCPNRADGIYTTIYLTLEHMMRNNAMKQSGRMFKVLLPYCKETDLPEAACTMYRLPGEMSRFVNNVHNLSNLGQKLVFLCRRKKDRDFVELKNALVKAQHDLVIHTKQEPSESLEIQEIELQEIDLDIGLKDEIADAGKDYSDSGEKKFVLNPTVVVKGLQLLGENNDNDQPMPRESCAGRPLLGKMEV